MWGSDRVDLGTIEVSALTHRAALAISKGKEPKGYPHTDPNEDAVAGVAGERGMLLVCADGHNGFESVQVVVNFVAESVRTRPRSGGNLGGRPARCVSPRTSGVA